MSINWHELVKGLLAGFVGTVLLMLLAIANSTQPPAPEIPPVAILLVADVLIIVAFVVRGVLGFGASNDSIVGILAYALIWLHLAVISPKPIGMVVYIIVGLVLTILWLLTKPAKS